MKESPVITEAHAQPNQIKSVEQQIAARRAEIPKKYRRLYDRAMSGKSPKAARKAQCLECVGWVIKEVFRCTDSGCPLHPYRPTSRAMQGVPEDTGNGAESTNAGQGLLFPL